MITAALRGATSEAAHAVGLAGSKGRLAPGFDADLLVVSGDPVTEPERIHDVQAVFARGIRVPSDDSARASRSVRVNSL